MRLFVIQTTNLTFIIEPGVLLTRRSSSVRRWREPDSVLMMPFVPLGKSFQKFCVAWSNKFLVLFFGFFCVGGWWWLSLLYLVSVTCKWKSSNSQVLAFCRKYSFKQLLLPPTSYEGQVSFAFSSCCLCKVSASSARSHLLILLNTAKSLSFITLLSLEVSPN